VFGVPPASAPQEFVDSPTTSSSQKDFEDLSAIATQPAVNSPLKVCGWEEHEGKTSRHASSIHRHLLHEHIPERL